ncbi:hypothetical protein [Thiobacter aerophilum]|uniref:Uncharacterized protein n=1 Tax=Thiobacter aerophilum TaxID=3121275 RepID=A0ABV0ECJ0_9BURK
MSAAAVAAGFAWDRQAKGEAAGRIDEGKEVAAKSIAHPLDGIHRQVLPWDDRDGLGLARLGVTAHGLQALPGMAPSRAWASLGVICQRCRNPAAR